MGQQVGFAGLSAVNEHEHCLLFTWLGNQFPQCFPVRDVNQLYDGAHVCPHLLLDSGTQACGFKQLAGMVL
jgi:hypothetical protein